MKWAVIDIDGTLSDCHWRRLFATDARLEQDPAKRSALWDDFHSRCRLDPPHRAEVAIVRAWSAAGHRVIYLTGRPEKFRSLTQLWLAQMSLPGTSLIMRGEGNWTRTTEYKHAQLKTIFQDIMALGDELSFFMEDNDHVVAMWRKMGYTCLQPRTSSF